MRIPRPSVSYRVNSRDKSHANANSNLTSAFKLRKDIVRVKSKKQKEKVKSLLSRVVTYFKRFKNKGVYRFKLNEVDQKTMVFKFTDEERYFSQVNESKRAVKVLVELCVNSDGFLEAEGIFRLSPSKTEELQLTTNQIIENFEQHDNRSERNHLVASRIKNELSNSLTTTERISIERLVNKCCRNSNYIPNDSELPAPLLDVIRLSRAIHAKREINWMDADNLATVLAPNIINGEKTLSMVEYLSKLSPLTKMLSRCIEVESTRL